MSKRSHKKKPGTHHSRPASIPTASDNKVLPKQILENYQLLKLLLSIKDPRARTIMLRTADPTLTRCIEAIARNLNNGVLLQKPTPVLIKLVQKHKHCLDRLASNKISLRSKQAFIGKKQTGGFLGLLLRAIPAIASAIGSLFTGGH